MSKNKQHIAAEAISSESENEVVIYARVGDYEGLKQASEIIGQSQAQIVCGPRRVRVRKKTVNGQASYEMTTKSPAPEANAGVKSMQETTTEINEDIFNVFVQGCDQAMVKTRYVFPIEKAVIKTKDMSAEVEVENLVFEVDVFTKNDGTQSKWCKIDVEVQSLLPQLAEKGLKLSDIDLKFKISSLPFNPQAAFVDTGEKTGEMRDLVTLIYEKEFITYLD